MPEHGTGRSDRKIEAPAAFMPVMGGRTETDIEVGARVVATQALPEGIEAGAWGTVVGAAGWIGRRWRVQFDDGPCVAVPEYALARHQQPA